ncbi:MAG: hypothetical protein QXZ17_09840 [Nitrososphaerota archaeon]
MNEKYVTPLIKEHRVSKLIEAMECIERYPFNRLKQIDCIVGLYSGKTEKSVFRGMVIPSLRILGLIIGFGDAIRLSSNGKLILEGNRKNREEAHRVARAVFLEVDKKVFHFIQQIRQHQSISEEYLIEVISQKMDPLQKSRKKERIKRWLEILKGCGLVKSTNGKISLENRAYEDAEKDLKVDPKRPFFKDKLFITYKTLSYQDTAGVIDIAILREQVALSYYREYNMILTEMQFDDLLREIPLVTSNYMISLGQTMGAEEKLFFFKGNYYRTLSIIFFEKGTI